MSQKVADSMLRFTAQVAPGIGATKEEFAMPFGALVGLRPGSKLTTHFSAPPVCRKCEAFIAPLPSSTETSGTWTCAFCLHKNPETACFVDGAADYIVRPLEGVSAGRPQSPPKIIAIDVCTTHSNMELMKNALTEALEGLDDDVTVGLLSYGVNSACAFRLDTSTEAAGAHADVVMLGKTEANCEMFEGGNASHLMRVSHCRRQLSRSVSSVQAQITHQESIERLKNVLDATTKLLMHDLTGAPACLPPEVQEMEHLNVAAHLIILTASQTQSSTLANGIKVDNIVDEMSERAARCGIVVDAITYNASGDYAAALSCLVHGTGGLLLRHAAAGSALSASLKLALTRRAGMGCTMEIRCSQGLEILDAIGPIAPISAHGKMVSGWDDVEDASLPPRLRVDGSWSFSCNLPETNQAVAFLLQCPSSRYDAPRPHVHFQVCLSWKDEAGSTVHRVINRSLRCGTADDAAEATDMKATAVLLSKIIAGRALETRASGDRMQAEIIRRSLVEQLRDISLVHGEPDNSSQRLFRGPSRFILPRGSLPLAHVLYYFHQFILRYTGAQTDGDREVFFQGVVSSDFPVAERMCIPKLHVILPSARQGHNENPGQALHCTLAGPALELQFVPPVDLALFFSIAGVLDCGLVIYIWLGKLLEGSTEQRILEACRRLAQEIACSRAPEADIVVVKQDTRDERAVLQHLIPICSDLPDIQLRQLPILPGFSKNEIAAAVAVGDSSEGHSSLYQWLYNNDTLYPPSEILF